MSMQSIMSASMSLSKLHTMQSASTRTQGRINVLESELKADGGGEKKKEQISALDEKLVSSMSSLMDEINKTNEDLNVSEPDDTKKIEKEKEKENVTAKKKDSNMDTFELSGKSEAMASAEVDNEATTSRNIPVGEPVIYKPERDAIRVTSQLSGESYIV